MKEHIEALETMLKYKHIVLSPDQQEALRAAIELMRAAEPLDPKAEREHCQKVFAERHEMAADWAILERERAAVRAECYVRQARSDETFEKAWSQMHYQYGEDALEQVRLGWEMAESRRLAAYAALVRSAKELSAAQAEIERVNSSLEANIEEQSELSTKLSNLRRAVGLTLQTHDTGHSPCNCVELSAAYEASKMTEVPQTSVP